MEDILISVIVAIHGVEKYLSKCLSSLVDQDFKYPYEVICINDSPNDNCPFIIDEYIYKYPHIFKRLDTFNKDLGLNRNDGIKMALGKYICFVDGDDFVYSNYLNVLYELVKDENINIGIANFNVLEKGKEKLWFRNRFALKGLKSKDVAIKALLLDIVCQAYAWNKIYRKDFLLNYNIQFFPANTFIEDQVFNVKAFFKCEKINFTKERIYCYVQRDDSILHKKPSLDLANKFMNTIVEIKRILIENNYPKNKQRVYYIFRYFLFWSLFCVQKKAVPKSKYKDYIKVLNRIKKASTIEELEETYQYFQTINKE